MTIQEKLEDITKSFPSTHKVREFLESGEEEKLDAAELYIRQRHDNYGLNPEDEANLEMLIDMREDSEGLQEIYSHYQED